MGFLLAAVLPGPVDLDRVPKSGNQLTAEADGRDSPAAEMPASDIHILHRRCCSIAWGHFGQSVAAVSAETIWRISKVPNAILSLSSLSSLHIRPFMGKVGRYQNNVSNRT